MSTEEKLESLLKTGNLAAAKDIVDSLDSNSACNPTLVQQCAIVYRKLNEPEKAAIYSSMALKHYPRSAHMAVLHSGDLMKLGQLDQAEAELKKLPPDKQKDKQVLWHLGKIRYQQKDFLSAIELLEGVTQEHPSFASAHMELAHALLMVGHWEKGWQEYEWRYRMPHTQNMLPRFKMPAWDGRDIPHLLLIADQGYGDCFQFGRYIPLAKERCEQVTLLRSEPLARLTDTITTVNNSYQRWEDTPLASAYCTLSDLPRLFDTRPDNIPGCTDLLHPDEETVSRWVNRLKGEVKDGSLSIGIAWSGRPDFGNNYLRAMPFEKLHRFFDISKLKFFSLQVGMQESHEKLTDLSPMLSDFAETAAAMQALDLIITTDTSIVHLAGTLGRPAWLLLDYAPDWRWGESGSGSPWYPCVRIFRQKKFMNWDNVVAESEALLRELAASDEPRKQLLSITEQQ